MRTPASTYRLQIRESFDSGMPRRPSPAMHDLGADWLYSLSLSASLAEGAPTLAPRRRGSFTHRSGSRRPGGAGRPRPRPPARLGPGACSSTSFRITSASRPRSRASGGGIC
jgi:hypothetical protein